MQNRIFKLFIVWDQDIFVADSADTTESLVC